MLVLSLLVGGAQAAHARLAPQHRHWSSRPLIAALCYLQPLVRSWARYRTRLLSHRRPRSDPAIQARYCWVPWLGSRSVAYWSDRGGPDRVDLLGKAVASMNENSWGKVLDSGWFDWDIGIYCQVGTILKVSTVQEDHGEGRRLIRVRYRLSIAAWLAILWLAAIVVLAVNGSIWATLLALLALGLGVRHWWQSCQSASRVVALFDTLAHGMELVPCPGTLESSRSARPLGRVARRPGVFTAEPPAPPLTEPAA
jgi:hypothetical protein